MPLVRVEVRNVYGLGGRELYEATDKDDPKDVLDGVAVAGLVGILRQLGDLAEFAAEVFHDLQEQVMFTAARSRKMIVRVQLIEATLPPLEKAVMSQTSHLHFAYTAGSVWHPSTRTKHNHFIHSDLPRFIMNSYDECRDPPCLHLLDKFDTGGPGVCLRRYSDPSFFKKALAGSDTLNTEKVLREKKATKIKKKGSRRRNGSISWNSGRVPFTSSNSFGQSSANGSFSTSHTRSKSEVINRSLSFDMRTKSGYIECVFGASSSCRHGDQEDIELPSSNLKVHNGNKNDSMHVDEKRTDANITDGSLPDQNASHLTSVTWDEKIEITEPNTQISQKLAKIESVSQFPGVSCDIKHFSGASLTKEQDEEHKHCSTLSLKSKQKGLNGSIDKDKQKADAIDHTNQGLLQDKNSTSPSYVTWHEKVEISVPSSQLPCNVLECENEAQLLCKSGNAESAYSASPSMDHGDQEHQEFSVSTLEVQDGDAIGCNELQELKIEGSDCLAFDSLQELNFPCGSIASRDEFSTSRLNIQQNGDDDLILHDEMKEGTIDNLAYELIEQNTSQVSSFWSGRMERVEPDSQSSNSTIDEKAEAQLRTQSLEFTKLEKDAAIRGILSMEDITFNSIDLPSEDDQFDEDGSGTDKYMDALNTLESESETDSECQPTQQIKHISAKLRNDEIKHVPLKMHENGQNSEESSDHFVASAPKISSLIYSEDLVQAEPPLITEHSCGPDISEVNVLCQRTHNLDVSVVNPFHSFTMVPSSSGSSISDIEEMHEHCCNMETTIDESLYRSPSSSMEFSKYSENLVHAESPHIVSGFSSPDTSEVNCHSKSTDNLDISEEIALDSSVNIPSSSGFNIADSQDPAETLLLSSFSASLESSTEISDTSSIKVWTNGGLLGLEPSKPLGPSVPNIVKNDFVAGSNENEGNPSNGLLMAKYLSNGSVTELEMLVKNPSQMEKNAKSGLENVSTDFACQNDLSGQLVKGSMNVVQAIDHFDSSKIYYDKPDDGNAKKNLQTLSATAEDKFSKCKDSPQISSSDDIRPNGLIKTSPVKSLAEVPSVHDRVLHSEASQDNINSPSTNFGCGAANGKTQNGSFHNSECEAPNLTKVGLLQLNTPDFSAQEEKAGVGERVATLENEYPVNTCASPPLEHMKISFHPVDVFATSKLKLKFPGAHHFHESIKDVMFPSFHLLPESAIAIQDIESESDDDTFYGSSSCISDEDMSQQSESTFEQWEPGEIPELEDDEVFDALRRISSDESISNAFELCGFGNLSIHFDNNFRDHHSEELLEPMHNNRSFDLPTLDAVDPFKNQQEKQCSSDSQDCTNTMPHLCNETTPLPPPPLPPAQWWVTRSNFNEVENVHNVKSNGAIHLDDEAPEALSLPTASSKPSPFVARSQDPQFNGYREDDQTVNAKEMDDREDLLLQIRTKSFNLRRTTPTMSLGPSGPKMNTKVAAVLEKAQAIRQAYVGSNEGGGDESWSDG